MHAKAEFSWIRFLLAAAGYLVPTFPIGYVWHLVLFEDRYRALGLYRDEVIVPFGLAAMTLQTALFAWTYPRLFDTARNAWIGSACRFFGTFGLLAWSFTTLPVAAKYQMNSIPTFIALETGFTLVHFLVVSPLIALAWRDRS